MVDNAQHLLGVLVFISPPPFRHGVDAGDHVIQFAEHIIGVVEFPTFENVGFNTVEETEIHALFSPFCVVLFDGSALLKQVLRTRTVGDFEGG